MHTITVDTRMLNSSGIGTYIRNLLPEIISASSNTRFNLLGNKIDLQRFSWSGNANVSLIDCSSPIYSFSEQLEITAKIPPCNIFWSPHYNVPLFPVRAKKRVVTIHDVFHLAFFDQLTIRQKMYARLMLSSAVKLSDKIITVSKFSKSEIMKHTKNDGGKITVIHNGVNIDRFRVLDNDTVVRAKEKLRFPEKFILFVGNVKPHKNLKRLISAYKKLFEQGMKEYRLVIVGRKEGFITGDSKIFKIINSNSALREMVLFTGYLEEADLPYIYNAASLLVFPSLYEGFGLPLLEAMACGCPVVVSNTASLPEVCGDAAYYADPHSVESIADGMHRALTDEALREALIRKGLERAGMFSWKRSAEAHVKIIQEVLNN